MVRENQQFERRIKTIMRYASLFAPAIVAFYCSLIQVGLLPAISPHVNYDTVMVAIIAWLALSIIVFFMQPSEKKVFNGIQLYAFYILATLQTLFITGVASPLLAYWILLIIASFIYFGRLGMIIGVAWFVIMAAADVGFMHTFDLTYSLIDGFALLVVLTTSAIVVNIYQAQHINHRELTDSREREGLERDRVLTLMNNLTDAVLSTNALGIVTMYNAAALSLLDTNKRLTGTQISELLPLRDTEGAKVDLFDELTKASMMRQRDDLLLCVDEGQEEIRLEATFAPIKGNHVGGRDIDVADGYVVILRDVTKAKTLEEERDEFISVVSHELRTPITIAEGSLSNAQVLLDRDVPADQLKKAVKESHDQVLFLARMVNDLSTLSRAERGVSDDIEEMKLKDIAEQVYSEYAPQAEAQKLQFNIDISPHLGSVRVSRLYLEELLQNLVTNAIKYTPKGSVTLIIRRTADTVTFKVKDTGVGISKSDIKKIFEKFYRAEDYRTRETRGTGLGLYVSQKLVDKLNTKLKIESRLNHGSTFWFVLSGDEVVGETTSDAEKTPEKSAKSTT